MRKVCLCTGKGYLFSASTNENEAVTAKDIDVQKSKANLNVKRHIT